MIGQKHAEMLQINMLQDLSALGVKLPFVAANARHVYHLFVIQVENRNKVLKYLNDNGIGAGIHYPIPLHKQPAYSKWVMTICH